MLAAEVGLLRGTFWLALLASPLLPALRCSPLLRTVDPIPIAREDDGRRRADEVEKQLVLAAEAGLLTGAFWLALLLPALPGRTVGRSMKE